MRWSADQVSLNIERIVNNRMDGNQPLSRFGRFKALRLPFPSSKRLMRVLGSIIGVQSLLVQAREANFAKRRSVGSEFVGDDNRRNEALTSKQFPKQSYRRSLVAPGLNQDLENLAFAVDSAPHIHFLSRD